MHSGSGQRRQATQQCSSTHTCANRLSKPAEVASGTGNVICAAELVTNLPMYAINSHAYTYLSPVF